MDSRKSLFKLSRTQWISVAVLASSVGLAAAVSLNTFTAGSTISASAVNANFTALNNALPLIWASTDSTAGGIVVTATSAPRTINSVSIDVPAAGHLIITGSVFVNNDTAAPLVYNLNPLVDGASVTGGPFSAANFTEADTVGVVVGADSTTLSYSVTAPVTAGAHTVSQQIFAVTTAAATATAAYFYNRFNQTVVFVPGISGFTAAQVSPGPSAPTLEAPGKGATPQEYGL